MIPSPSLPKGDPDRLLQLQTALEVAFETLVEMALAAGWEPDEIMMAITELADNHMLMRAENGPIEDLLARLKKRP